MKSSVKVFLDKKSISGRKGNLFLEPLPNFLYSRKFYLENYFGAYGFISRTFTHFDLNQ